MKFIVKNLGKIREANIEVKPLTIFVGENGTQKSLVASKIRDMYLTDNKLLKFLDKRLPKTKTDYIKNCLALDNKFFIIEEPEAHLHPKAQIETARFLALLVNNGVSVLITTHSDYIIHEISNYIKLFNLNEKEQKKFLKDEGLEDYPEVAISQDKVAVYLFKENDVERLRVDKFGIEDKVFEDVVDELFERSTKLGEKLRGKQNG